MAKKMSGKNQRTSRRRHSSIPAFKKRGWHRFFGNERDRNGHSPKPLMSRKSLLPAMMLR